MAPMIGIVSQVLVQTGDRVIADEPLIHLDDEEARARIATSQAQVEMRQRARNDQGAGKGADRRRAEDAVADAETSSAGQGISIRPLRPSMAVAARTLISRRRVQPGALCRTGSRKGARIKARGRSKYAAADRP